MSEAGRVLPFEPARRDAPALGMSVVMNMPGDRQATLQCFVAQEDGEEAANQLLDRMFRIADRQRARYELVDLSEQLAQHQRSLANFDADFARIEMDFAKKKVEREAEIEAYIAEAERLHKEGYDKWYESGRRGDYVPQGSTKQAIDVARGAAKKVHADIEKAEAERTVALGGIHESQKRYAGEIKRLKVEIDVRKVMLGIPADLGRDPEPDGA